MPEGIPRVAELIFPVSRHRVGKLLAMSGLCGLDHVHHHSIMVFISNFKIFFDDFCTYSSDIFDHI